MLNKLPAASIKKAFIAFERLQPFSEEGHMKGRKHLIAINAFYIDAAGNLFNIVEYQTILKWPSLSNFFAAVVLLNHCDAMTAQSSLPV